MREVHEDTDNYKAYFWLTWILIVATQMFFK